MFFVLGLWSSFVAGKIDNPVRGNLISRIFTWSPSFAGQQLFYDAYVVGQYTPPPGVTERRLAFLGGAKWTSKRTASADANNLCREVSAVLEDASTGAPRRRRECLCRGFKNAAQLDGLRLYVVSYGYNARAGGKLQALHGCGTGGVCSTTEYSFGARRQFCFSPIRTNGRIFRGGPSRHDPDDKRSYFQGSGTGYHVR